MLKIHHTEWPAGREPRLVNKIKEGGLWGSVEGDNLVKEAKRIVQRKPIDEVARAMFWVRVVVGMGISITGVFYIINL
ncbi:MAG: hypothetical protein EOO20_01710 [Chryseobacterium sp.]|nr:MAG: hypothetical protein EOO20_01710 [Chryseobacterium sp.]